MSVRIRANGNAFGALFGNGDFNYASINDSAGNQISAEVSVVSDYLLNSLDGVVFDTRLGTIVRSKWRVDLSQGVYFLTASLAYLGSGAIRDINLNPNHDPSRSAPEGGASGQVVWNDYDMNFVPIISLTGDIITAPADGGLGDGNPGNTLIQPAGISGNNQERLTSTLVAQRMAFRRFVGDVQNNTRQTVTYYDVTGARNRLSQAGGANPFTDDNNGTVWDWDLAFAPSGHRRPKPPSAHRPTRFLHHGSQPVPKPDDSFLPTHRPQWHRGCLLNMLITGVPCSSASNSGAYLPACFFSARRLRRWMSVRTGPETA